MTSRKTSRKAQTKKNDRDQTSSVLMAIAPIFGAAVGFLAVFFWPRKISRATPDRVEPVGRHSAFDIEYPPAP